MTRRASLFLALAALAACSGDSFSFGDGTVRGYTIEGSYPGLALVEYSAPPVAERRARTLLGTDGRWRFPIMVDWVRGGFYAERVDTAWVGRPCCPPPSGWALVRVGNDWNDAAVRSGTEIVGADTMGVKLWGMTPNGQFIVGQRSVAPSDLVVLDATTLAIIRTVPAHGADLLTHYPWGGTGAQMMLRHAATGACAPYLLWVDMVSGAVADSVQLPCNHTFLGAVAPNRLLLRPDSINSQLVLYDPVAHATIAQQDTLGYPGQIIADSARGELVELMAGYVVFVNAATLKAKYIIQMGEPPLFRSILSAALDPVRRAVFGISQVPIPSEKGLYGTDYHLVVLDLDGRRFAADVPGGAPPAYVLR